MRWKIYIVLIAGFLALAGCKGSGSAEVGGSDNSAQGRVKLKMPF